METTTERSARLSLRNIRLTGLFKPEDIIHHTTATTQEEVVRQLLERLAIRYGIGSVDAALEGVQDRISKGDVEIGPGIAVPHVRLEDLAQLRIAVATSEDGIKIGDALAKLIILILVPVDMPGAYMQTLQGIAKVLDKEDSATRVAQLRSPLAVWQYFDAGGHNLPDHLEARHIMTEVKHYLNENDNLAKAIDLFLDTNASELPVLDDAKELIGVVTTSQLVRVCLPDYLMWMEDMTPFLNFEPFAEIIRRESSTWLNDIMIDDYAQVTEDSPAIMAMKEIGSKQTDYAYVVRNRKLVGIIRLHEFLRCVLR
ncbi:MAG: PTS sugar transporter subunit IIA [Planctomycetes bacterium]|nr:PTS sugar transporter subunit IIA [Planctomycetota bacterium]